MRGASDKSVTTVQRAARVSIIRIGVGGGIVGAKSVLHRSWRFSTGQSLTEFCLCLPLLLIPFFLVIDYGFIYYNSLRLSDAAREGARAGGRRRDNATVRTLVKNCVPDLALLDSEIAVTTLNASGTVLPDGDRTSGARLEVTIGKSVVFMTPLGSTVLGGTTGRTTLTAHSCFRVEQP